MSAIISRPSRDKSIPKTSTSEPVNPNETSVLDFEYLIPFPSCKHNTEWHRPTGEFTGTAGYFYVACPVCKDKGWIGGDQHTKRVNPASARIKQLGSDNPGYMARRPEDCKDDTDRLAYTEAVSARRNIGMGQVIVELLQP